MSTRLELLKAYLKHNNLVIVEGECWDPLIPFLVMDCVYQIYNDTIKPLNLKHQLKRYASIWSESYKTMNNSFFRSFDDDQRDDVIDMMDEFQEWMKDDIDKVTKSFNNSVPVEDTKIREIVSACLMTSALVKAAMFIINNRFSKVKLAYGNPIDNLLRIERSAIKIASGFYGMGPMYNPNADESLSENVGNLCERMIQFLKQ